MSKVRKSIVLSFGQSYINFIIQFLLSIIIARLLTPADIGIFSIAMVVIGFAHTFRDFGVSNYVIQEKELTPEKIRAAFALTLITAWTMAAAIGLGSGYAAEFYREPGIKSVMLVLSLNFVLIPFGTVPMAYMHREMDFKHISLIKIISSVTGALTIIGLAYAGFSYHSLAWGSVAGIVCTILLVQIWRPKNLPLLPSFQGMRNVLSFGSLSSLVMVLHDMCEGTVNLILGRLSGMSMVGYFERSMGLVSMFERFVMKALWSVALPHFAERARTQGALKNDYLKSMSYVSVLAWPFFISLGLLAHPVVITLYGRQWLPSIPLLQLFCIAMTLTSPFLMMSSMMTAIGQMKQNLYALLVRLPIRAILVFMAAPKGLVAIGATFIISALVDMTVNFLQCHTVLNVHFKETVIALRESAKVAFVSAVFPLALFLFGGNIQLWSQLLLGIVGSAGCWLLGLFLFKHPLRTEIGNSFISARRFVSPIK